MPDNVTASGQTISAIGSGKMLSMLVTAGWGSASGTATVVYSDGSTTNFTVGSPDWFRSCPSQAGPDVVIYTPYRNQASGRGDFSACVFFLSVPLQAGKMVERIVLPNVSTPVPGPGTASLHIFAVTIK